MISVDQAFERLLTDAHRLGEERVALERAHGRVLAEDVKATNDLPTFSNSIMDGYAVSSGGCSGEGPWVLPVRGESRAGRPAPPLGDDTACRIFSGAELPAGADCVLMQENVTRQGDDIIFTERPRAGQHVRARGSDLRQGSTALAAGGRLTAGRLALAASLGRATLVIARRPILTVVSTGDELQLPGGPLPPGSVVESNSFVIATMARQVGAHVRVLPFVPDDAAATERALASALSTTDVLVTVGGSSVGDHDHVRPALDALGVSIDIERVAIKPGKPFAAGRLRDARVLCLPGHPASATLVFLLFGVPLVRALQGDADPLPAVARLPVWGQVERSGRRQEYLRARLETRAGEACAVLLSPQAGALTSMANTDALVVFASDRERIEPGQRLPVVRVTDLLGAG